jgi:hypothetical protein
VSTGGGRRPQWRRDGRELFYIDRTDRLTAVSVAKRGTELTFGAPEALFEVSPSQWGRSYAVTDGRRFLAIRAIRSNEPQPIIVVLHGIRVPAN